MTDNSTIKIKISLFLANKLKLITVDIYSFSFLPLNTCHTLYKVYSEIQSIGVGITGITLTSMGAELQSQNRVDVDYEKTTGPIFLKF